MNLPFKFLTPLVDDSDTRQRVLPLSEWSPREASGSAGQESLMAKSRNERKTENIVRDDLRNLGYYPGNGSIIVEEQQSDLARVQKLLEHASKKGVGVGKPEFIIRSTDYPDFIIVIECKPSTLFHASPTLDRYADFAVDGALLYASFLSRAYDVLAIAVSGQDRADLRISHYIHLRGEDKPSEFPHTHGFVPLADY